MFDSILMAELVRASLVVSSPPPADLASRPDVIRPATVQCFYAEATRQSLEPIKLLAVLKTEGGKVGQFARNTDGSYDIGPMQINSIHLPDLSKEFGITQRQLAQYLAYDGCFNVAVGAWMLRKRTNESQGDFWYGIGRYHSKTPSHRNRYILRVHEHMTSMVNQINAATRPAARLKETL